MKASQITELIRNAQEEKTASLLQVESIKQVVLGQYQERLDSIRKMCPHQFEDGSSAIGSKVNICIICGKPNMKNGD
jgi:hypothetical protein